MRSDLPFHRCRRASRRLLLLRASERLGRGARHARNGRLASVPATRARVSSIADGSERVLTRSPDCSASSLPRARNASAEALAFVGSRYLFEVARGFGSSSVDRGHSCVRRSCRGEPIPRRTRFRPHPHVRTLVDQHRVEDRNPRASPRPRRTTSTCITRTSSSRRSESSPAKSGRRNARRPLSTSDNDEIERPAGGLM
jgi:hypothetical protein